MSKDPTTPSGPDEQPTATRLGISSKNSQPAATPTLLGIGEGQKTPKESTEPAATRLGISSKSNPPVATPTKLGIGGAACGDPTTTKLFPSGGQTIPAQAIVASKPSHMGPITSSRVIPGAKIAVRPEATIRDLRKLSPSAKQSVLEAAVTMTSIDVLQLTLQHVITWGEDAQRAYGNLVTQNFQLAQSRRLVDASNYIAEIITLMEDTDLESLKETKQKSVGFLGGLRDVFSKKKAILPKEAQNKIANIISILQGRLSRELVALKSELDDVARKMHLASDTIEATAIAARYLAEYMIAHPELLIDRTLPGYLEERSTSLFESAVATRLTTQTTESRNAHPLDLVAVIQDVVLRLVPDWLSEITDVFRLNSHERIARIYDLDRNRDDIIAKIRTRS